MFVWRKISVCDSYSINEAGEVRNDQTGALKKPYVNKDNGYLYVDLWQDNRAKKAPIHRLLAEAFLPNPEGKPTVDHIDGNRTNNKLSNLRWATYAEQNSRFDTRGVRSQRVRVTHFPEERKKRGGAHLRWLPADFSMYFDRIGDAAEYFGVTRGNISLLLSAGTIGRRGKTRGYLFEYEDSERHTHANV